MALELSVIGKKMGPDLFTYNQDTVILYALGIGAGIAELEFVYEKDLRVFPTFGVIPLMSPFFSIMSAAGLNLHAVLHGEQKLILRKPVPPSGTLYTVTTCESIYDKGDNGAVVNIGFETRDEAGTLFFENKAVIVDRSAGNFGGDRGPKAEKLDPPDKAGPDFHVEQKVPLDQAALYRLSGDKNPLHIDPAFAKEGGFDRPILHGLCSFGYAARALFRGIDLDDPARLKSYAVRFMNVVYPGDTLITEGWKVGPGRYILRATNQHGKVVLGNASAVIEE